MTHRRFAPLAALLGTTLLILLTAACGSGSSGARGTQYSFVALGGQTHLLYDPPESRGAVSGLEGEDLADPRRRIALSDFPGQVVVLNLWGAWCAPCRAEMPDLQQLHQMMVPRGVSVLGVDVRDDRDAARDLTTNMSITYPNIFDQSGRALLALRGFPRNTVPATIVFDRRHRVAAVYLRQIRLSELARDVGRIAAEEPPPAAALPGGLR